MERYILVKYYILVWVGYFLILLTLPATYSNGEYYSSILYLICSVLVAITIYSSLMLVFSPKKIGQRIYGILPPKNLKTIINYSVFFSLVSITFIAYDRVVIQGVDYSKGLAFAREQWRVLGENRNGISSIFSFLGNLLSGFPIVLSVLLYLYYDEINKRLLLILTAIATVGVSALLTGGRSIVMMLLISLLLIGLLRKSRRIGFTPKKISLKAKIFFLMILTLAFIYMVYVFHLRATAGGDTSQSYMLSTLNYLGGRYTGEERNINSTVDNVFNYLVITGGYLVHSAWTFQSILDLTNFDGAVTFNFYRNALIKLMHLDFVEPWTFAGLFSTYLGAFYYDYGVIGAIFSSFFIGVLIFISTLVMLSRKLNLLHIAIFLASMYVVMLSPLLFAVDIMSYPFILFDFCLLYFLSLFPRIRLFNM